MIRPPEDICARKLQKKHMEIHKASVKAAKSMTDTSVPKSLTLTHLKSRGKKDQVWGRFYMCLGASHLLFHQLRKDRLNHIAKTDRLLKSDIEKVCTNKTVHILHVTIAQIMFTKREQPKFEPIDSMNLKFRLQELKFLDKNNHHMYENLKKTGPSVATREELSRHWNHHLEQSYLMRKKHFGVLPASPLKKPKSLEIKEKAAALSISRQNSEASFSRQNSRGSLSRQNSGGSTFSRSSSIESVGGEEKEGDGSRAATSKGVRTPKIKFADEESGLEEGSLVSHISLPEDDV
jgi:hypothetical protein